MKVTLLSIGKTNEKYLEEGMKIYLKRLTHYTTFQYTELKDVKSSPDSIVVKNAEAKLFISQLTKDDFVVLLDEHGTEYTSVGLSKYITQMQNQSTKKMVFIIGGAFGFGEELVQRANAKMALSKLTFSHQMVRLFFMEQLYRAFTIIKGEKYHNE
jgi:23S rRNA (pseudouridine1915-N3)-methyltransferase